jgi:hypothetical protein
MFWKALEVLVYRLLALFFPQSVFPVFVTKRPNAANCSERGQNYFIIRTPTNALAKEKKKNSPCAQLGKEQDRKR